MAQFATASDVSTSRHVPRHSALVRVTHWIIAGNFLLLLVSGFAILLAHPRLYWGETGGVGGPSVVDLPLPFVLTIGIRGPGRALHVLSAWVCVLTGLLYFADGVLRSHFRRDLLPARSDLAWKSLGPLISDHIHLRRPRGGDSPTYNVLQRIAYLSVIFILFPLMIWTGLAMSPAITSVVPWLATVLGGQQSARTIHFVVACALVLFLFVHIAMVIVAGFGPRVRAMVTGGDSATRLRR